MKICTSSYVKNKTCKFTPLTKIRKRKKKKQTTPDITLKKGETVTINFSNTSNTGGKRQTQPMS